MTVSEILIQIRSVRKQLDILEAKVRDMPRGEAHYLADLEGMLKDEARLTDEEIEAALYPNPRPEEW